MTKRIIKGFITLTRPGHDEPELRLNVAHIVAYHRPTEKGSGTRITTSESDDFWTVAESPDDIDQLIGEAS